jgi:hypothetical protein
MAARRRDGGSGRDGAKEVGALRVRETEEFYFQAAQEKDFQRNLRGAS